MQISYFFQKKKIFKKKKKKKETLKYMSQTSTKSVFLTNHSNDTQQSILNFQKILNKMIRSHIRHYDKYNKISNGFETMAIAEQSDTLKNCLHQHSYKLKQLEEYERNKTISILILKY